MDEASTSYENILSIYSVEQDPNAIVEVVYKSEQTPEPIIDDGEVHFVNIIQTQSQINPNETDSKHRYKCPECERGFQNVGPLKCHYRKAHRNSKPFFFLFDSSLKCNICDKNFEQKAEFDQHTNLHIKKKEIVPIVESHQCHLCQMCFPFKSALENHYNSHNTPTSYTCVICKTVFLEIEKLNEHYLKHYEDQDDNTCNNCSDNPPCACRKKLFSCGICKASFNVKKDFQFHCTTYHANQKPFKCDICSAGFSSHGNLKRHADIHTSKRPFECDVCNKTFRQRGSLKQHLRTHTKERPYMCEVCYKWFTRKSILEAHERTHSNPSYVCQECHEGFTQLSSLHDHLLFHNNEEPFQCDVCYKVFSLRSVLKAHKSRHKKKKQTL